MPLKKNKMNSIYEAILEAKKEGRKLLAILLDPDKVDIGTLNNLIVKINQSAASHVFIGGSLVHTDTIDELISRIKQACILPVVLFPGNPSQISILADGILFLSLISGRNPDYLIEHQVNAVPLLRAAGLEVISTGYLLIESGSETAVSIVSQTTPLDRNNLDYVLQTAQAGEFLGNKLIYLEAGSGAKLAVPLRMIRHVAENIRVPLIVGGGIRTRQGIQDAYDAGADLVVIGTAFENNFEFFNL